MALFPSGGLSKSVLAIHLTLPCDPLVLRKVEQRSYVVSSGSQAFSVTISTLPCPPVCLLCTASGEKKEGWSWESYLKEQKAITAPVSLFQDVSGTIPA